MSYHGWKTFSGAASYTEYSAPASVLPYLSSHQMSLESLRSEFQEAILLPVHKHHPIFDGHKLDLWMLFLGVLVRGGLALVEKGHEWPAVVQDLGVGLYHKDAASVLRKHYKAFLLEFKLKIRSFAAVREGSIEELQSLLTSDPTILDMKDHGLYLLHMACDLGDNKSISLLLNAGADKDKSDINGRSPLFIACERGFKEIAEMLLKAGADKEQSDIDGYHPLLIACKKGFQEIVEMLINSKMNLFAITSSDQNVLHVVSDPEIALLLIKQGVEICRLTADGTSELCCAVAKGNVSLIRVFIDEYNRTNISVDQGMPTPLFIAVKNHQLEVVKLLIDADADPNVKGMIVVGHHSMLLPLNLIHLNWSTCCSKLVLIQQQLPHHSHNNLLHLLIHHHQHQQGQ